MNILGPAREGGRAFEEKDGSRTERGMSGGRGNVSAEFID